MKEKVEIILKEKYKIIYIILVILILTLLISNTKVLLDNSDIRNTLNEANIKNQQLDEKINSCNEQIKTLGKTEKQQEINNKINELENKKNNLDNEKKKLEQEINQLNGEVIRLKSQPKSYPAGHLTAGTDIPIGRYKIYGGSSNFVVYSSYGSLEVNIILGKNYGVSEYIYTFKTGDKIEANSSFNLVEVE